MNIVITAAQLTAAGRGVLIDPASSTLVYLEARGPNGHDVLEVRQGDESEHYDRDGHLLNRIVLAELSPAPMEPLSPEALARHALDAGYPELVAQLGVLWVEDSGRDAVQVVAYLPALRDVDYREARA